MSQKKVASALKQESISFGEDKNLKELGIVLIEKHVTLEELELVPYEDIKLHQEKIMIEKMKLEEKELLINLKESKIMNKEKLNSLEERIALLEKKKEVKTFIESIKTFLTVLGIIPKLQGAIEGLKILSELFADSNVSEVIHEFLNFLFNLF